MRRTRKTSFIARSRCRRSSRRRTARAPAGRTDEAVSAAPLDQRGRAAQDRADRRQRVEIELRQAPHERLALHLERGERRRHVVDAVALVEEPVALRPRVAVDDDERPIDAERDRTLRNPAAHLELAEVRYVGHAGDVAQRRHRVLDDGGQELEPAHERNSAPSGS
jgi:hypothetical protein